jgi:hypothetical protein
MDLNIIDPAVINLEFYQHAMDESIDMFLKSAIFAELIEQLGVTEDPEVWCSVIGAFVNHQQYFNFSSANSEMGEEGDAVADTIKELNMVIKTEDPRDTDDLNADYSEFLALTPEVMDEGKDHSESFALAPEVIAEYETMVRSQMDGCLPFSAQEPVQEDPSSILQQSDNTQPLPSYMDEMSGYQSSTQGPSFGLDYSQPSVDFTWNSSYGRSSPNLSFDGNQLFNQQFENQYPINMQPAQSALSGWLNLFNNPQQIEYDPFDQVSPRAFPPLMVIQNFGNTVIHNY